MKNRTPLEKLPHVEDVTRRLARANSDPPVKVRLDDGGAELEADVTEVYRGSDCLRVTIEVACRIPLPNPC